MSLMQDVPQTPKVYPEEFEEFWKYFPKDDGHGAHPATRIIKTNKKASFTEWQACIDAGYIADNILMALLIDVERRQQLSNYKSNLLKYLKSPKNWLKDREFADVDLEQTNDEYSTFL